MSLTLDVGCGKHPRGDVNLDLNVESYGVRASIDVHATPNFVKAHADFLPFKNRSFHTVIANHVLEHMNSPLDSLREWMRVASKNLVMAVPSISNVSFFYESERHLFSWTPTSIRALLNKAGFDIQRLWVNNRQWVWARAGKFPAILNFVLQYLPAQIRFMQRQELIVLVRRFWA